MPSVCHTPSSRIDNASDAVRQDQTLLKSIMVSTMKTRPLWLFTQWLTNLHTLLVRNEKKPLNRRNANLPKEFLEAKKAECQSWIDNEVFDLVDMRKTKVRNFVAGRWVLTVKKDKDGNFQKCKTRWILEGFQDKQKNTQQTDSPAASRAGFRCATQLAANFGWDLFHMDLKTAFLQGEAYD